ncbi:MAG: rhodanese-like domain-containing protein [Anaerolineales bacterium]|nr:rhodanese-like domain-containing protein [Anaerolineales bacterium]
MTPSLQTLKRPRIVFLVALLYGLLISGCSKVPELLSPADTLEAQNDGALIVDIRTREDFSEFHIAKSVNIPLEELPSRLDEIPSGKHIILVCTLGRSSLEAREILLEAGYASVSSMEGGVMAWYDAGYPGIFGQ